MNEMIVTGRLPALSDEDLEVMNDVIAEVKKLPPIDISVEQFFHAGIYVRTCFIPAGCVIVGALIKIPTVVQVSGHCKVSIGSKTAVIDGVVTLKADAGRRQAFLALEPTYVTMSFATKAKTFAEAEKEFTDEYELLTTTKGVN